MKRKLALLLALALTFSLLTACVGQTEPQADASQPGDVRSDAAREQYLNTYVSSDPSTLDCARFLGIIDREILHSITEPLTRIQDGLVTAAGAERW